jgi:very-short-patch-repair endonuclease
MRREPTYPEYRLWRRLRGRQVGGLYFRRQHPLGSYILDFFCAAHSLAVELDGRSHDEQLEYDAQRTAFLNSIGIRAIRFADDEVLKKIDEVVYAIACECGVEA